MPGTKKTTPPGPAQWIGGQRRKLVRRDRSNAGPPRSSTMPALNPDSAAASLVSSINSVGSNYVKDSQSVDSFDHHTHSAIKQLGEPEEMMQFYPPSGPGNSSYAAFLDDQAASSPKLTAPEHKKKQGLFGSKKSKPMTLEQPKTSSSTSVVTSPLPVSTPSKAAKFFGLEAKPPAVESPCRVHHQDDTASDDGAPPSASRQTKFKGEYDVEPDQPPKTSKPATKGLRMRIPEFAGPKRSPIEQAKAAAVRFDLDEEDEGVGFNSGSHQGVQFQTPASPHPVRTSSKSKAIRRRPLNMKDFPRMSPITEASFESLRPAYREGKDATELGVISEYEYGNPSPTGPVLPRSQAETILPKHNRFELDANDLSPTDRFYDGEETDGDEDVVHPGTKVNVKRVHWQQANTVQLRSPLQFTEDAWLDATEDEMRLEARRMTIARVEAEKQAMDAEIAELRRKHEALKLEFASGRNAGSINAEPELEPVTDEGSEEDDTDLVSLRSSIDLDEEPTVHEAQVMTFTRITPGMVKLVDIPPRKQKAVDLVGSTVSVPDKLTPVEHQKKTFAMPARSENMPPPSPVVTHYHPEDPDCSTGPKKSKLTRDESRLLVQDWISDYNGTEQRPISTRVDPDVLADQETPPAPFPKDDESLLIPPIKPRSDSIKQPRHASKHNCINNGHIFHPVDLKTIPDNTVINTLEVRPYIQTYTGVKQHVKIPVVCERCGKDCDENVWECEIPVCRMAVCQNCAEDMEVEWQERAVNGWKYK